MKARDYPHHHGRDVGPRSRAMSFAEQISPKRLRPLSRFVPRVRNTNPDHGPGFHPLQTKTIQQPDHGLGFGHLMRVHTARF